MGSGISGVNDVKPYDDVNGTIVGGDYFLYAIIAPTGREQTRFYSDSDDNALTRYREYLEYIYRNCREDIMELIYGKGEWELRQLF